MTADTLMLRLAEAISLLIRQYNQTWIPEERRGYTTALTILQGKLDDLVLTVKG